MTKVQIKNRKLLHFANKNPPTVFSLLREILQLYDFLFYFISTLSLSKKAEVI